MSANDLILNLSIFGQKSVFQKKNNLTIVNGGMKNSFWQPAICILDTKLYWMRRNGDFLILDYQI
jgi:hypothetical protein